MLLVYCAGVVLTVIYLFVGFNNGAPRDAIYATLLVYVASPLLWLVVGSAMATELGQERTVRWLLWTTFAALLSIVLFFYAYLTFGRDSVKFLAEEANVNVKGGFAASTMLVYGSMIFLTGALYANPAMIRPTTIRSFMLAALVAAAATSGRSAFLIAIPIGLAIGAILRPGLAPQYRDETRRAGGIPLLAILGTLFSLAAGIALLNAFFAQLDFTLMFDLFLEKLRGGGGVERVEQNYYLWKGIEETAGLGHGHGVGLNYLRNEEFPWRYELLLLATILRVGLLGVIIYALPFVMVAGVLVDRFRCRALSPSDIYMAGGLAAALVATVTNPYLESFIFQWMYYVPLMVIGLGRASAAPRVTKPPALVASKGV